MSWVAITAIVNIMPNIVDVTTATITANFAAFGLLAPSSFETRTLYQLKYPTYMSNFVTKYQFAISKILLGLRMLPYCSIETQSDHQYPKLHIHAAIF